MDPASPWDQEQIQVNRLNPHTAADVSKGQALPCSNAFSCSCGMHDSCRAQLGLHELDYEVCPVCPHLKAYAAQRRSGAKGPALEHYISPRYQ